jgi:hypothetical protein
MALFPSTTNDRGREMKRKPRKNEFMGPDGFYLEATPEKSEKDVETIRRENADAAERARAEEARLAALPDSARTIVFGDDE